MKKLFLIIAICMGTITAQGKDRLEQTVPAQSSNRGVFRRQLRLIPRKKRLRLKGI